MTRPLAALKAFLIVFAAALASVAAQAQDYPPRPAGPIYDGASMLSTETEATLDARLRAYNRDTGRAIIVATVPDLGGVPIEQYATGLFGEWGIGGAERDQGLLLLISRDDRRMRIEIGYGLHPYFGGIMAGRVINDTIPPRFKAADFDGGVAAGIDAIVAHLDRSPAEADLTMIGQECIDELADFAGLKDRVAAITERAMQGELDFASALTERVGLLANLDESAIGQCLADRIRPMEGARTLVATLKAHGCRTVLVTGGFHHFADPVAEQLGFERVVGNRLAVANGRLTGALAGPIADSATKLAVLGEEAAMLGEGAVTLVTGDGANDIPMIAAATYGVAYRAKPKARAAANGRIDRGDLTSVLRLLGIPESEWVGR
ncbi:phosphoserine phosphatase SerB [Leptolyngbya sp. 15MV]|nr:phosphoserine phosphatase SerB [Leptolyngbya sp. 15MV]